jgi:hypothetical protein
MGNKFDNIERSMIFSPIRDISANEIRKNPGHGTLCIVRINLVGEINLRSYVGFAHFVRFEKPHTEQDFKEIDRILNKYKFLRYNKELNKLEGYENYI